MKTMEDVFFEIAANIKYEAARAERLKKLALKKGLPIKEENGYVIILDHTWLGNPLPGGSIMRAVINNGVIILNDYMSDTRYDGFDCIETLEFITKILKKERGE